jgi:hypothetical protein
MDLGLMSRMQESSGQWQLPAGRAQRVAEAPVARVLAVTAGRLWVTGSGRPDALAPDVWLDAGDEHVLPAGAEVVVEGWPQARFALLEAPMPAPRRLSVGSWARRWRERLQWTPRPCGA